MMTFDEAVELRLNQIRSINQLTNPGQRYEELRQFISAAGFLHDLQSNKKLMDGAQTDALYAVHILPQLCIEMITTQDVARGPEAYIADVLLRYFYLGLVVGMDMEKSETGGVQF
jgi:hypothetical protein